MRRTRWWQAMARRRKQYARVLAPLLVQTAGRKKAASEPGQLAEQGGTPVGLPACRRHTLLAGSDRERNVERRRQQSAQSVQRSGSGFCDGKI